MLTKKKLATAAIASTLFFATLTPLAVQNVEASDLEQTFLTEEGQVGTEIQYEDGIDGEEVFEEIQPSIGVRYVAYDETVYMPSTKSSGTKISYTAEVINKSTGADKVSRSLTREKFVKAGVSTSAEFNILTAKVGVKAEGSFGKSSKVTVTYTWSIPAKTKTTIQYGSKTYATTGYMARYSRGNLTSKTYVNSSYSTAEYSNKTSKGL
ncbi:hypothetical protein HB911_13135 [Listeria booriae]|uniref:hypothetical protein n=1 Tax=Listeria booriae TaxID=1552123 RepID=UPI001624B8BD|nr:hypothetical protein [Listeria booriae]MBC1553033.1 hypothetical protein [Listeria booriae]MBC1559648.1 hypothetical protein [Listeria booriae]MBC1803324.1 hypothetical protein [Listeria booriae]